MRSLDIGIAVISETHLNRMILDSVVSYSVEGYTTYRRDRDWGDTDKRKNGGVAIYVREHLKVLSVQRDNTFEMSSVRLILPSGHQLLVQRLQRALQT